MSKVYFAYLRFSCVELIKPISIIEKVKHLKYSAKNLALETENNSLGQNPL